MNNTLNPRVTITCSKCGRPVEYRRLDRTSLVDDEYVYLVGCHGETQEISIPRSKLYQTMECSISAFEDPLKGASSAP